MKITTFRGLDFLAKQVENLIIGLHPLAEVFNIGCGGLLLFIDPVPGCLMILIGSFWLYTYKRLTRPC